MKKELSAKNMERYFLFALQEDDTYAVTFFNRNLIETDKVETLVIPSTYNGKPVTVIEKDAFSFYIRPDSFKGTIEEEIRTRTNDKFEEEKITHRYAVIDNLRIGEIVEGTIIFNDLCEKVKNVVIPDSITIIGDGAFTSCKHLISIEIGNGVKRIERGAFSGCASLKEIQLPNGITELGFGLFSGCKSLNKINIPSSVTKIERYAFYNCESLTEINLPDSVTSIGYQAFSGCSVLTSITIPDSVTEIGAEVFDKCSALKSIVIGNGITDIDSIFSTSPSSLMKLPSVTNLSIGKGANKLSKTVFDALRNLETLSIDPENPSFCVKDGAFYSKSNNTLLLCFNIPSVVTILDGTSVIAVNAFIGRKNLTGLVIPASVKRFEHGIISFCDNCKTIFYKGTKADWDKISIDDSNNCELKRATIYYYSKTPSGNSWNYAADGVTPEITHTGLLTKLLKKINL